jgi:hypothetical protein
VEKGKWASSLATVSIAAVVYVCLTDSKSSLNYMISHPLTDLVAVLVLIGVLWGIAKWWLYVLGVRDGYEAIRKEFVSNTVAYRHKTHERRLQNARAMRPGEGSRTVTTTRSKK